ncbi:TetR/AcrR family transcriptional regulator [Chlorobium sp. KB01]|uniref:TetR/AcrR family transcriptional regulator n=1 Tax=Chlorobium sp. KB01 TaxID=1917528 RepID=UPI000978CAE8|nr:TetR/AcrR family transcriptional regulator [Chlorobium sp. KB01]
MARPIKTEQIPNLQEAIKDAAWVLIAESGAPALSLRAIARALKITAPAIYNYFPDRDALVTALIIDAFTSFGDVQLRARDSFPSSQPLERLQAIGLAYRHWALSYPQRYQLIFGTPIPGYEQHQMAIIPSATRSISALVSVIEDIRVAGKLKTEEFPLPQEESATGLSPLNTCTRNYHMVSHGVALIVWSRVHGLVSLEIGGRIPPFGVSGDDLYHYELQSIARQFIQE